MPKQRFLSALADDPALATSRSALLTRSVQAARQGNALPEKARWQEVAAELGVTGDALYRELSRRRAEPVVPSPS